MTKKNSLTLFFLLCAFSFSYGQIPPPSADDIMKEAYATASKENKKVLIMFHASWCGWCHKMDSSLNDKSCKKFFDDNFVIRHMVVFESKGKENLENPGALDMLTKYKGKDEGIPYWLIFDKSESFLFDSRMPPAASTPDAKPKNTGCPASKEEVDYFIDVLKKTTSLKGDQLEIIRKRFRKNDING
jgi:thiol-disulfide isomerase/thioredoxin